ncbi:MAG: TrkH family potassium uptake protein [Verrucomicrobia bacterium]|nr:TrkH family potassium uptake protein [Verrucomicrobiota bacterium]
MDYREIFKILGTYLFFFAPCLLVPIVAAIYFEHIADPQLYPQPHCLISLIETVAICLATGALFRWWGSSASGNLFRREGLMVTVLIWFLTAGVGALPFWLSGTLSNPIDAYFESMSGLTTTGSTVMQAKQYDASGQEIPIVENMGTNPDVIYTFYGNITPLRDPETKAIIATGVEAVSKALLLWRSFLQWIGGMGIVVLFVAILPALGVGGKLLYQAEAPGPIKDAITPRVRETASLLWKLYAAITVLQVVLLWCTNPLITWFDALCISFSTISTGGFAVYNASIAAYQSATTDWIVIIFMLLGSISFIHYANIIKRKISRLWEGELLAYLGSLMVGSALIAWAITGTPKEPLGSAIAGFFSWGEAIRYGTFQLVSSQSSTGFATANFNHWPFVAQMVMLTSMFIGGMSSSTAGGVKVIRYTLLLRMTAERIEAIFRPNAVRAIHVGAAEVGSNLALNIFSFFFIAISLALLGTFLLVLDGVDLESALSAIACMQNNIGLAFRAGGPAETFAYLTTFGKGVSILWMVMGRLEFLAVILLFLPSFWKNK